MTAYVVFVRETVTDEEALNRGRERTPAACAWHASPGEQATLTHRLRDSTGRMYLANEVYPQPASNE